MDHLGRGAGPGGGRHAKEPGRQDRDGAPPGGAEAGVAVHPQGRRSAANAIAAPTTRASARPVRIVFVSNQSTK